VPQVSLKEILDPARRNKYGVPSLLGGSLEMVIGQLRAAEEKRASIIFAFNQEVAPGVPPELGIPLLVRASEKTGVPVTTILDHGRSLEEVARAIRLGISSVMFDGSGLPYKENVRRTREVVVIAHATGVDVEGELGAIAGSAVSAEGGETEAVFTDPGRAADFVRSTGVDALAISFGNVHGVYRGSPRLDLERVRRISSLVDVPLVMHGGSGLGERDYAELVDCGIAKFGYYTSLARGACEHLRALLGGGGRRTVAYHELLSGTIDYFYAETKKLLDYLRATGTEKGGR
jgi:fructose-bisphosphate aldolase class II